MRCSGNNLSFLDVRNGNNTNIINFSALDNPNLTCVYVDDAEWSVENWTYIDPNSTFVETEQECIDLSIDDEQIIETSIYPNPVENVLYIDYKGQYGTIKIYNILGKLIFKKDITDNKIDVSILDNGTYILTIETEIGKITQKIIKY